MSTQKFLHLSQHGYFAQSGRSLHLVDIENLVGYRHLNVEAATATAKLYRTAAAHRPGDLTVVAASHHNGFAAKAAFPEATVRWRSGRDGADLALLDALHEFNLDRFDRVVIGSGDGIFTDQAEACQHHGLSVSVVARLGSIAERLAAVTNRLMPAATSIQKVA